MTLKKLKKQLYKFETLYVKQLTPYKQNIFFINFNFIQI